MGCNCGKRVPREIQNNPRSQHNPWMCRVCGWVMHRTSIDGTVIRCCRNGKCSIFEKEQ